MTNYRMHTIALATKDNTKFDNKVENLLKSLLRNAEIAIGFNNFFFDYLLLLILFIPIWDIRPQCLFSTDDGLEQSSELHP